MNEILMLSLIISMIALLIIIIVSGAFSKKIKPILLSMLILVICFTTACNQKNILDSVISTDYERVNIPEHVLKTFDNIPTLSLKFDADVIVPETTAYSVMKVTKRNFSDEEILSFIKTCGSKNDELYSEWNLTKDEWQQKLDEAKQYEGTERVTQDYLDSLQKEYDNAKEEVNNPLTNISALPTNEKDTVYVKTGDARVGEILVERNGNTFAYFCDVFASICPASMYTDDKFDKKYDTKEHFSWCQPSEPEISKEDAYNEALKYMNALGIDLDLFYAEPCTILTNQVNKTTGWIFTFTRTISDLSAQFWDGDWAHGNAHCPPSFVAPWPQEACEIVIDKEGLCKLWWQGASKKDSIVAESAQLLNFESVTESIVNQLNNMYGKDPEKIDTDFKVIKIELGISLISNKDEVDNGIYIPTWYVSYKYKPHDSEDIESNWSTSKIIFSATDGSYIEPRMTYDELENLSDSS